MACWSVLLATQHVIADATGEPWPGRAMELTLPDVEVLRNEIRFWYGQCDEPALTLGAVSQ